MASTFAPLFCSIFFVASNFHGPLRWKMFPVVSWMIINGKEENVSTESADGFLPPGDNVTITQQHAAERRNDEKHLVHRRLTKVET